MKKLLWFYLENCPYCRAARRALDELIAENPAYAAVDIEWVEESEDPVLADQYDYYYVPTFFLDGRKLSEARPGESYETCRRRVREALDAALGS